MQDCMGNETETETLSWWTEVYTSSSFPSDLHTATFLHRSRPIFSTDKMATV